MLFVARPTKRASISQGIFRVGRVHARHFQKGFGSRWHSPKKEGPQAINQNLPMRVRAKGDGPLGLEVCQPWLRDANARPSQHSHQAASTDYCIQRRDTPDQIRAADTPTGRSVSHLQEFVINGICRTPNQTHKCGTRPF